MAERTSVPADEEEDRGPMVEITYYTAARWGERMAVPLKVALTEHPDAQIVAYADGTSFQGQPAKEAVKETKAEIREERAAERAAASEPDAEPARARKRADEA